MKRPPLPTRGFDLHEVCKRAAGKLNIPWPKVQAETSVSRYAGKRLPRAKQAARQLLPIFPECLEEAACCWKDPFSAANPIQQASAFDFVDMKERGFYHMPPVEPLVASHLHPIQRMSMSSSGPTLPTKADRLQSSMTDEAFKSAATSVRALNAASLLLAY